MNLKTINISLFMLGLACATACSSDGEPSERGTSLGEEMKFDVRSATRSVIRNDSNVSNVPFSLYGDLVHPAEGLKVVFNGKPVTYDKQNGWNYGSPQYWLMGQEHSFIALHPYGDSGMKDLKYENSRLSFTYETKDYAEINDVLIASHRRRYNLDKTGSVDFEFGHLLARIDIKPALDEALMYEDETDLEHYPYNEPEFILFHTVEISGILDEASYVIEPAKFPSGEYETYETIWKQTPAPEETDPSRQGKITADMPMTTVAKENPRKVTNNKTPVSLFPDDDALLVLPQTIAETQTAQIKMTYTVNDDFPLRTITFPLSGITWEPGKTYTYTFTISKAYNGQIESGSISIEIDDSRLPDNMDDSWIDGGDEIRFGLDGSGGWGPK